MDKRTKTNILLLGLIVLLLFISTGIDKEEQVVLNRVSNIDAGTITDIRVSRKNGEDYVFIKQADGWHMQSPLQYLANETRINAMLRMLKAESHAELEPAAVQLARFELDDPDVTLQLNEHVFRFGNTDGIDQRRYVLFNDKIYMVNDFLYQQLETNAEFFADTRLLKQGAKIATLAFPDNTLQQIDGVWQMQQPIDIKPGQIERLVYSWENAVAISVSSYKEPETDIPITITTADNRTLPFNIVDTDPHLILGRKDLGLQYHMGSDDAQKLLMQENTEADSTQLQTAPPAS